MEILSRVTQGVCLWLGSEALTGEIKRCPQIPRRGENLALLAFASSIVGVNDKILDRARQLQVAGYYAFDAMHLASAEAGYADVLLTTDDRFLKRASRGDGMPLVPVRDPVSWLKETFL